MEIKKLILFLLLLLVSANSFGSLKICNKTTTDTILVAIISKNRAGYWRNQGWVDLYPEECSVLYDGDLTKVPVYYYAVNLQGKVWSGDKLINKNYNCINTKNPFSFPSGGKCEGENLKAVNFIESFPYLALIKS